MSSTQATARQARQARKPDFIVRAPDPQRRGRWLSLGAAWKRDEDDGFNVKLNTVPVGSGWDGTLVLLPPLVNQDEETARE
jgi:hypothetical protein